MATERLYSPELGACRTPYCVQFLSLGLLDVDSKVQPVSKSSLQEWMVVELFEGEPCPLCLRAKTFSITSRRMANPTGKLEKLYLNHIVILRQCCELLHQSSLPGKFLSPSTLSTPVNRSSTKASDDINRFHSKHVCKSASLSPDTLLDLGRSSFPTSRNNSTIRGTTTRTRCSQSRNAP